MNRGSVSTVIALSAVLSRRPLRAPTRARSSRIDPRASS